MENFKTLTTVFPIATLIGTIVPITKILFNAFTAHELDKCSIHLGECLLKNF